MKLDLSAFLFFCPYLHLNYAFQSGAALTEANLLLVPLLGSTDPISSFNNYQHVTLVDQDVNRFNESDTRAGRFQNRNSITRKCV